MAQIGYQGGRWLVSPPVSPSLSRAARRCVPGLIFAGVLGCKGSGGVGSGGAGGNTGTAGTTGTGGSNVTRRRRGRVLARGAAGRVRDLRRESGARFPRRMRRRSTPRSSAYAATPDATTRDAARAGVPGCARQLAGRSTDAVRADCVRCPSPAARTFAATSTTGRTWTAARSRRTIVSRSLRVGQLRRRLLPSRRGLWALEYLLFYEGADTACASSSPAFAAWPALAADERDARKRAYAGRRRARRAGARDGARRRRGTRPQMNFVQTMRIGRARATPSTRRSRRRSNPSGSSLFFVDRMVKDKKLDRWPDLTTCMTRRRRCCFESPLRGPLEGEPARQPGRPAPDLPRAATPATPGCGFDDLLDERRRRRRRGTAARRRWPRPRRRSTRSRKPICSRR